MSWPLSQDYNEAIQDPRSNFNDAELQAGEAVANALGIPMPRSGNFADVYEVRCPSGARWAVKCFTREIHGRRERYAEISSYLRQVNLPFMVDFQYLEKGIRVRGRWFPVLKMQWVEGFILNEFVRDNLDKKPILQALGQIWLRMARRLRQAQLAHGDLQHGNVMFVPGSSTNSLAVKLIDYDGMCVPSLAGKSSGEVGHPAYQHPERLRSGAYNQEIDRFSLLSVAAALRCLMIGGRSLWQRYDNGDNLLFRQADFQTPAESPLFRELLTIRDPQAQLLVQELYRACQGSLSRVPLLSDLVTEEKPAGKEMTAAPQVAVVEGVDWDFGAEESGALILRKSRASAGIPLWAWGALGGVAALLLSVGMGTSLFLNKAPAKKKETLGAQVPPAANTSNAMPESQPPTKLVEPQPKPALVEEIAQAEDLPAGLFCLAPNGDKLAFSDSGDKDWRLIDPHSNQLLQRFCGHTGPVTAVAFSADGRRAVTSGGDKMLRRWDVPTGKMIDARPAFGKPALGLALSLDGNKVAVVNGGNQLWLWDFESKKGHSYNHSNRTITSVVFSPDGRYFVFGLDKSEKAQDQVLVLWPLVKDVADRGFFGPSLAVSCIALSPDGKYIASGHVGETCVVALWETATSRLIRQHRMAKGPIHQLLFSPDGRSLLAAAGSRFQIWAIEQPTTSKTAEIGGGDSNFDCVLAAFASNSREATLIYRQADRIARIQTVSVPWQTANNSPPVPPQTARTTIIELPSLPNAAWGRPWSTSGAQFQEAEGKLTIALPGKENAFDAQNNVVTNRASVMRVVEGDFIAEVRVQSNFPSSIDATAGNRRVLLGAAGLYWQADKNTYMRLERSSRIKEKRGVFVDLTLCQSGKAQLLYSHILTEKETSLRLERRGTKINVSFSEDGQKWISLKPIEIPLPAQVQVGVIALSTSRRPFLPTFDRFLFQQGQADKIRVKKWLTSADGLDISNK